MSVRRLTLRPDRLEARLIPSLTPVGLEFQVNQSTASNQWHPAIGTDRNGDFVVAFAGYSDSETDPGWGIFARCYQADGTPVGDQFRVATLTSLFQSELTVAKSTGGNFVVAWVGDSYGGSGANAIFARCYNADGAALTPTITINNPTSVSCFVPSAAMDTNGNFSVAWLEEPSSDTSQIKVRRFNADGTPLSASVIVASETDPAWTLSDPRLGMLPDGSLAVVWRGTDGDSQGITARIIGPNGEPAGPEFAVNQSTAGGQVSPDIAVDGAGNFVVTWHDFFGYTDPTPNGVYARRFSASGAPLGNEMRLNEATESGAFTSVASNARGDVVVSWEAFTEGYGSSGQIVARTFRADGTPSGETVELSTQPMVASAAAVSDVAIDNNGGGMAVWQNTVNTASNMDVFGRRFVGSPPQISQVTINDGHTERSTIRNIRVAFDRTIVFPSDPSGAFVITGPSGTMPFELSLDESTSEVTFATLTFPTELPNGHYTLQVLGGMIQDIGGQVMESDYLMPFHRFFGDFDGDARVDGNDFEMFRNAFGSINQYFDLDGDGDTDARDFVRFRMVFGSQL